MVLYYQQYFLNVLFANYTITLIESSTGMGWWKNHNSWGQILKFMKYVNSCKTLAFLHDLKFYKHLRWG